MLDKNLDESIEIVLRDKAKKQTKKSLQEQAEELGITSDKELRAFLIGSWDAMIFDMVHALNLPLKDYQTHAYRQRLIKKWLAEGLLDVKG